VTRNIAEAAARRLGPRPGDPEAGHRVLEQAIASTSLRVLGERDPG
jgi:hypothetical protein